MPSGQYVFSQVMAHLPMKPFRRCVQRYQGNRYIKSFTCLDQFLCMAFAQLTCRESLRDIEVYVLVAIIKKRLQLATELYTILQILSLTLFEKVPLYQLLRQSDYKIDHRDILN